jgi:hypothetical protein
MERFCLHSIQQPLPGLSFQPRQPVLKPLAAVSVGSRGHYSKAIGAAKLSQRLTRDARRAMRLPGVMLKLDGQLLVGLQAFLRTSQHALP